MDPRIRQVAIGSIFRNSTRYIPRYFDQLDELRDQLKPLGVHLRPVLVEGDSTDRTYEMLDEYLDTRGYATLGGQLVIREHGGIHFGSVDDPLRWKQLSIACNGVLDGLMQEDDALIYVESDLCWTAQTMIRLLGWLNQQATGHEAWAPVEAVAPFCFTSPEHTATGPRGFFYDIWGHIGPDGQHFQTHPPHHPLASTFDESGQLPLVPLQSAGSCVVATGERARAARFSEVDCIRGYCRMLGGLWLDPGAEVRHP